jgi:predicted Fe-S protein YdhL (DUF1289 family)
MTAILATAILSPCIRICTLDGERRHCLGCGRTLAEIAGWAAMPAPERERVMALLPARLAALQTAADGD